MYVVAGVRTTELDGLPETGKVPPVRETSTAAPQSLERTLVDAALNMKIMWSLLGLGCNRQRQQTRQQLVCRQVAKHLWIVG